MSIKVPPSRPPDHALDSNIQKLLQLSNFESKFDVKDLVGSVSESLINQSNALPGPFDPKPFIRTFEAAVDTLIHVRKDVQEKSEKMEKSVRLAEREYSRKMTDLNRGFETVGNSFLSMESKMGEVGRTAIRIGEQLESVANERQRAQAAYDLVDYYNLFAKGDTVRLDSLRKEGRDGRRKVAVLLRRLTIVAKEVDLPTAEKTRDNIERYCEKFEKDMLYLFDRCYRKGDPKMMHHCAQTLLDFNGGASCVQVYVNQHDFFINKVTGKEPDASDHALWEDLPNPNKPPPKDEKGLSELFLEIRATVGQEAQIVQAVFPNPSYVMQVFLQRVFAQSIQEYMEQLLHRASQISDLSYLRMLQLVHAQAALLVEDLKAYELPTTSARSTADTSSAVEVRSISVTAAQGSNTSITAMLETAMEELFIRDIEGIRYLERESKSLTHLYVSLLSPFARYHEKILKTKTTMLDRVQNTATAQVSAALLRFGGLSSTDKAEKIVEEALPEEDGYISIEFAERILKWHAEAVGRCVELTPANDVAKFSFALLRVLAEAIGPGYVQVALETALTRLEVSESKTEPTMQPLAVLHDADLICHLWQQYLNMAVFPLATSSVTVRREMNIFNNQTVSRIEGQANTLMQRITDAVIGWLGAQLSKQKRNDFKPRNDDESFSRVNTEPCIGACEYLEKVKDAAKASVSGKNLEAFLTEVGVAFHSLLLDHLRKFPVSDTGGLMLAKDLKSYQDTIDSFGIPSLHERFEFLRQLGNVFLVRPEILSSYITENYLGRIDSALLRPYLAQRSDWGTFAKGFDEGAEDGGNMNSKGRFGMRLSLMMNSFEGLRIGEMGHFDMKIPAIPGSFAQSFSFVGAHHGQ